MWTIFFQDKTNTSLIFEQPVFFRFALWKVVQHFLQGIQLVRIQQNYLPTYSKYPYFSQIHQKM